MSSNQKSPTTLQSNMPALKIGSQVRCTEDGVEGRIVWCNAVAVKIKWNDGEQVTWRRDSLPDRPIEILAASDGQDPAASPAQSADSKQIDQAVEPSAPALELAAAEAAAKGDGGAAGEEAQRPGRGGQSVG